MKKAFITIFMVFLMGLSLGAKAASEQPQSLPTSPLHVVTASGSYSYTVELADSFKEHAIGLMYRHEMDADHGMLFLNQQVRFNSFWMKNTYISLDIIFVDIFGKVINIAHNTTPLSLDSVTSTAPALAVLELNAGQAERMGLKPKDTIYHDIFGNMHLFNQLDNQ